MNLFISSVVLLGAARITIAAELSVFQPSEIKSDLALVRSALEEAHADLYRYTSKTELEREWDRVSKAIDRPMTALEFYRLLAPVLALIKDGHLGWGISPEVRTYLESIPILPLGVRLIEKTPSVFRDLSDSSPSAAGFEIVSVNDVDARKLVDDMWIRQMGDGDVASSRARGVGANFSRELIRTSNIRPPYRLKLRKSKSDEIESREYAGLLSSEVTQRWRAHWPNDIEMRTERPLSELRFFDDDRIGYIRIPSFGGSEADAKRRDLRGFFAKSFSQLKEKKSRALIVDVRDNGGGEDEAGQILASYLIDKPFRYYRDLTIRNTAFKFSEFITSPDPVPAEMVSRGTDGKLHFTGHPNLGIKSIREPGFRESLFILMNGASFSTAGEFLTAIRSKRTATFIGEESAGAYSGNNSGFEPAITLPNTKLVLRIPLVAYYLDISDKYPIRRGVIPDRTVQYTIEDMINGVDKELEVALAAARESVSAK